jgi:three-Cys-motif partner protein
VRKYLAACKKFSDNYGNFAYIDTHGGTGRVLDIDREEVKDGSVLLAAKVTPSFPCYVVEIDSGNFQLLQESVRDLPNVTLFEGDCNEKIDEILEKIPKGEKFVFSFLDPDGLVYRRGDFTCHELRWNTINKIASFPRSEVLINIPLEAILRWMGFIRENPTDPRSEKMRENISLFFGSSRWQEIDPRDPRPMYRRLVRLYIELRLNPFYPYIGAILITAEGRPIYYLAFGSKYKLGGHIMRNVMHKEYKGGRRPLINFEQMYPLNQFIFDD